MRSGLAIADAIAERRPASLAQVARRSLPAMLREHGGVCRVPATTVRLELRGTIAVALYRISIFRKSVVEAPLPDQETALEGWGRNIHVADR